MKQSVNPAIMAAVIIAVVAIIGFIGFKVFASSEGGYTEELRHKYNPSGGGAAPAVTSSNAPPGASASGYHGAMVGVGGHRPPGR
jgi:hypothetical protein